MNDTNYKKTLGLRLDPLDVLFFRDGRPYGPASRASSGFPVPQTLSGALRTALMVKNGCDFEALGREFRQSGDLRKALEESGAPGWLADVRFKGPWPAKTDDTGRLDVLVPSPSTLYRAKDGEGRLYRLSPLARARSLPGWNPPEPGMRPLWLDTSDRMEPAGGWLASDGLKAFLAGEDPGPDDLIRASDIYGQDLRTGIGIDHETKSTREGLIYGASFLALKPGFFLYAEALLPKGAGDDPFEDVQTVAFGGEGKRVCPACIEPFKWPEPHVSNGSNPLLLLTTPGLFDSGWRPNVLKGRLAAASVPGYQPVSGWDMARDGPKPNRFAARAGSVYFLDTKEDNLPFSLADDPGDQSLGWGCFAKGVWRDD